MRRVMGPLNPPGQGGGLCLPAQAAWHLQRAPSSARPPCGPRGPVLAQGAPTSSGDRSACVCTPLRLLTRVSPASARTSGRPSPAAGLADSGLPCLGTDVGQTVACGRAAPSASGSLCQRRGSSIPLSRETGRWGLASCVQRPLRAPFLVAGSVRGVFRRGGRRSKAGADTGPEEQVNIFPHSCCNILHSF